MKTMQRENRQLYVHEDQAAELEKQGYVEVDSKTGRPLKKPVTADTLKSENAALRKENKQLKDQVKELTDKLGASLPQAQAAE